MRETTTRSRAAWAAAAAGLWTTLLLAAPASAQFQERYNHTATLLPGGDILIVAGQNENGPLLAGTTYQVQISRERRGDSANRYVAAPDLGVRRASHTATLLPTGEVLVAGGFDGTNSLDTVQVYNPVGNCWRAAGGNTMSSPRHSHTATLLNDGRVLLCGGFDSSGASVRSCDLYTPDAASVACAALGASRFTGTVNMTIPRAVHTATLLPNDQVFVTGGFEPNPSGCTQPCSNTRFIVTSELYNPSGNFFAAAHNLIQERAFHRATLLGNAKVLITGGFNARDQDNKGFLASAEIYDPVANSMVPAASMQERKRSHSALLQPDGTVSVFGGLGNITSTYLTLSALLKSGSVLRGDGAPAATIQSTRNITSGILNLPIDITLSVPVSGIIERGELQVSSGSISFPFGTAYFNSGKDIGGGAFSGLTFDLAGSRVTCDLDGTCGHLRRDLSIDLAAQPVTVGQMFFRPMPVTPQDLFLAGGAACPSDSSIAFSPANITNNDPPSPITTGSSCLRGTVVIRGLPTEYIGGVISTATLKVTSGGTSTNLTAITIFEMFFNFPAAGVAVTQALNGTGQISATGDFTAIQGEVAATTTSAVGSPVDPTGEQLTGLNGTLVFVSSFVRVNNLTFTAQLSTAVVRTMMFADLETYDPKTNTWSFEIQGFGPQSFDHTATLNTSGDTRLLGGQSCYDPPPSPINCPYKVAVAGTTTIPRLLNWSSGGSMRTVRANHTTTLLPDGRMLAAGGSNGANLLRTVELFDPEPRTFSDTGPMQEVRDLHSATLLPNGRVLVAGGFTTNALSTGATRGAEIYYPESGTWRPTGSMNTARDNHAAVLLADGNVLVAGGYASGFYLDSAEIYYSTAHAWKPIKPMNLARALHTATLLQDGRVLVTAGISTSGVQGSSEIWDPATGDWTATRCFDNALPSGSPPSCASPLRMHSHRATMLQDGRILMTGGNDGFGEVDYSFLFDPVNAAAPWTAFTNQPGRSLNTKRFNHTATLLPNGIVLVAGGAQALGNSLKDVETYSVSFASWQFTGGLNNARGYHTTVLGKDGFLYTFGGGSNGSFVNSSEFIYFSGFPDAHTVGAPPSLRLSSITALDVGLLNPPTQNRLTLRGTNFHGLSEANGGGGASGNSVHSHPRLVLQALESSGGTGSQGSAGFTLDLSTRIPMNAENTWDKTNSSITVLLPNAFYTATPGGNLVPYGWHHLRVGSNAQYSNSISLQVGPPKPSAAPSAPVAVAFTSASLTWNWNAPAGSADGFNVYSATSGVFLGTVTITSDPQSFIQTGLAPNTTAVIAVAAYTLTGDGPLAVSSTYYTLSTAPVSVAIASVTSNNLVLFWNVNGNAKGTVYEVSQSTDGFVASFSTPIPTLLNLTTDNVLITSLQSNTTYYLRVRAFNLAGVASPFSAVVSTRTRVPVTSLSGAPIDTASVQWTWLGPQPLAPGEYFKLYNSTSGTVIATTTTLTFIDVGLGTNTSRSIMVSAVTSAGEGPLSASATTFTLAAVPAPVSPPIINVGTGSFTGIWDANGNPLGTIYEMVATMLGKSGQEVFSTTTTTTGFTGDMGGAVPASELFDVRVRSINQAGAPSAYLVLGTTCTLARPPTNLIVTGTTPGSISVSWDSNLNSSTATYAVTYTTSTPPFTSDVRVALPFSARSNQTSLTIPGLLTGTTYSIRVQAQNFFGQTSAFSAFVTTSPFNGGVSVGSIGGPISPTATTVLSGTLGNGRQITLRVPAQTFPSDVFITISSITVPPSPCGAAGTGIGISINVAPPLQPQGRVFLTLGYSAGELGAVPTNEAALNRVDDVTGRCVPLLTSVDSSAQLINAEINHFSIFQVAQVAPKATLDSTLIFPNPFHPSRGDSYVTFSQLPADARLRIFTMRGELVDEGETNDSGLAIWLGVNREGRPVASGVYLVLVESGGKKKIFKLVVLR